MPFVIERFVDNPLPEPKAKPAVPDGTLAQLKRFYDDTARTSNKAAMSALSAIIPPSQVVFGTDSPYRTGIDHVKGLREAGVLTDEQLASIERGTALKLIPRLGELAAEVSNPTQIKSNSNKKVCRLPDTPISCFPTRRT